MQVGDTIWVFDINRRVYPKDKSVGVGPIWREHWDARTIQAETSRSWIISGYPAIKVPKVGADARKFAFSQEEIDRQAWVHENRYAIERKVSYCTDYETLKAIAALF